MASFSPPLFVTVDGYKAFAVAVRHWFTERDDDGEVEEGTEFLCSTPDGGFRWFDVSEVKVTR
jgi:hypothetical protein